MVDSSALVAIMRLEADAEELAKLIVAAGEASISAANLVETMLVLDGRTGDSNRDALTRLMAELGIEVAPIDQTIAWLAHDGFRRFGRGRHPASLNFGNCFAYALARYRDAPLLFTGEDFRRTDVRIAR